LVFLGLVASVLFLWSHGTWPDPLVDFGRELYVPWRLSLGEVLQRDIAWQDGPLAPLANGLWFRIWGPGLSVLVAANVLVTLAVARLLYGLFKRAGSRSSAELALLFFLTLFVFPRYLNTGNYNFMTPYSHGLTHGLLCALLALENMERWLAGGRRRHALLVGVALGLVFLTKPEVLVAVSLACVVRLVCACGTGSCGTGSCGTRSRETGVRGIGVRKTGASESEGAGRHVTGERSGGRLAGLAGLVLGPGLVYAYLFPELGARGAGRALLGGWNHLAEGDVVASDFYLRGLGLDDVGGNLLSMGVWALVLCSAYGLALALAGLGLWRAVMPSLARAALCLLCALPVVLLGAGLPGHGLGRAWPLLLIVIGLWCWRCRLRGEQRSRSGARLALVTFALVLLGKQFLKVGLHHYGFVLALPATLVIVAAAWDWFPRAGASASRATSPDPVGLDPAGLGRAAVLGLLLSFLPWHLVRSAEQYRRQTAVLGEGRDSFLADGRGRMVRAALLELERHAQDATLLVLPEGVSLNYLTRRATPTPFINFMPPEFAFFGEQQMLAALEQAPPDLVLLIHKDTTEYGLPLFGVDYGVELAAWVRERYGETWRVGAKPLENAGSRFGVALLEPR
jgi:hypothetical protein